MRLAIRIHCMRLLVAVTLVLGVAVGGPAYGASPGVRFDRDGVSIRVPQGWQLAIGRVNGVVDPVTVFTVSTFRLQLGISSPGLCSRALQRAWRADGAYVHLTEERDGASRKRMLRRIRPRPKSFVLDAKGAGGLCTPADSGEFVFQDKGRAFYVFYGFGRNASKLTRARAVALLDDMRIATRK
jgi:hypothetical protein